MLREYIILGVLNTHTHTHTLKGNCEVKLINLILIVVIISRCLRISDGHFTDFICFCQLYLSKARGKKDPGIFKDVTQVQNICQNFPSDLLGKFFNILYCYSV